MLDVGRIVKPHGLKGAVTVELWTNREERMAPGARLAAGERSLEVKTAARQPDVGGQARWLVFFSGIGNREAAEALRGAVLQAEPLEDDDALWVHDLVGAELFDTADVAVGTVVEVEANPASDLLVLGDGRVIPLTFVTRAEDGRLRVDGPPGLLDL